MATRHLNQIELAARWNISPRTLERWRWAGEGPQFIKLGGRVVYRLEDVEAFEAEQIRQATPNVPRNISGNGARGMDMNIPNHITPETFKHMPVGEIASLPAAELARLQQETTKALRSAKMASDWLDGALALKYTDQADDLRRAAQKDTGTVRFVDGEVTVKTDLQKRVAWDQAQLALMVERIRAAGDDPTQIIDISYKVAERKFAAWPTSMQEAFRDARTVHPGKLKITLLDEGDAQ